MVTKTEPTAEPAMDVMNVQSEIAKAVQVAMVEAIKDVEVVESETQVVEEPQKDASQILDEKIAEVEVSESKVNEIIKQTLENKEPARKGFSVKVPKNKKPNSKLAKNNSVKTNTIKTND